jgi:hypothetical protein
VKEALDDSLKKLGLDYVDLYLLHWPLGMSFSKKAARISNISIHSGYERHVAKYLYIRHSFCCRQSPGPRRAPYLHRNVQGDGATPPNWCFRSANLMLYPSPNFHHKAKSRQSAFPISPSKHSRSSYRIAQLFLRRIRSNFTRASLRMSLKSTARNTKFF